MNVAAAGRASPLRADRPRVALPSGSGETVQSVAGSPLCDPREADARRILYIILYITPCERRATWATWSRCRLCVTPGRISKY